MDRAITTNEAEVVRWLLDHASVCDVTAHRLQVEQLHVAGGCDCGCASLYFKPKGQLGKVHMLADAVAVYPDGQRAGLILWGHEGEIVWLEVYDFQPESARRVPEVSVLCTWEELGRKQL